MRAYRPVASVALCALLVTACGARLTDEQRDFAIGGVGGAGGTGSPVTAGQPGISGDGQAGDDSALALPESGEAGAGGATAGSADGSGGASASAGGSSEADGAAGDGDGSGGGAGESAGDGRDTRSMPAGGNGGATDVGVTEDSITIANVADISGPVPGIFEDAQKAVAAFVAHFTATEGTIYGRQLDFLPLDSRLDSGGNRQQYLRACDEAVAAAGSMSAFEEGAADPISSCGLPDIRSVATSQPMQQLPTVHSAEVQQLGSFGTAAWNFWKEQHPEAVQNAAYLFLDNETTRFQTGQNRRGAEKLGYRWEYVQAIQVAETNYNGFILEMINRDIDFVAFQGDYTQAARLAQSMAQQGFEPSVFALQANIYTPDFLATAGSAAEGVHVGLTSVMLEEADQHEELQTYRQWLAQVDPSAEPTGLGMFAWSAAKLLTETLKEIGPEVTREAIQQHLGTVTDWDGGGLHPPQDIGNRMANDCIIIAEVSGGAFQRLEPADGGFRCDRQIDL